MSLFKAERGWRCVFAGLISLLAASISCDVAFEDIDDGDAAADTDTWPLSAGWDGASFALGALPDTANQIIENNFLESKLGIAVSGAGDVNGDGYDDVIVGAPEFFGYFGAAYVYPGSATGIQTTSLWSDGGASALAEFGASVARAGDVNGDGYDDIVVGAPFDEVVGWVGVYKGYWNGVLSSPTDLNHSETTYSFFGASVAGAGDVNGDGYDDVIVGQPYIGVPFVVPAGVGSAHVYHGSAGGVNPTAAWNYALSPAGTFFGLSVAGAGDVNGDGYDDVIVGAPFYDNGQNNEGAFFVFHGSAAGVSSSPDTAWEPDLANAQIGRVAGAVDVNADGYDDVIVGAPNYGNGQNQEGAAYLFYGSGDGVESSPAWMMESDTATSWFGYAVAGAGDVNNDGYDDILVSQYKYGNGQSEEGRALLFLGSADGPVEPADWAAEGDQANAHYGSDVAGAGDVNGDGYDDVIVGAWEYDNGQNDEGRAYIYHGQVTTTTTTTSTTSTTTTSSSTTTTEPTTTTSTTSSSTTTSTEASTSTTTTEAPTTSSTTTTTAPDDDTDDDTGDDDDDSECWACTSSTECQLAFGNGWGCLDNCCAEAGPDDDDDDTGDDDLEGRGGDDDDDGGGCGCGC